jgi:5-methylcytosine-specific restriction enzyme subunit McrC
LRAVLEPICDTDKLDLRSLRGSLTYNRLNSHYERAHDLAWMVLDALGIDDILASGRTQSFAFLIDMNVLFERFVERFFAKVLDAREFRVDPQVVHSSIIWNAQTEKPYSRVIPDLVVQRLAFPRARLVVDAKYKLYDEKRLDPSDIYQTFLYAYALSSKGPSAPGAGGDVPTALLAYPASVRRSQGVHLEVRPLRERAGARVLAVGIPIPAALAEIRMGGGGPISKQIQSVVAELIPPFP